MEGVGVADGGIDPGWEDIMEGVGIADGGIDPGVEGSMLWLPDDMGIELGGGESPEVLFPVTSCAASAQNATNKLASLSWQPTCTKLSLGAKKAALVQLGVEHIFPLPSQCGAS
jgi:hypothetical protein